VFVALCVQHGMPFLLYGIFPHPINGMIFGKKIIEHKMYVLMSSTAFV